MIRATTVMVAYVALMFAAARIGAPREAALYVSLAGVFLADLIAEPVIGIALWLYNAAATAVRLTRICGERG